MVSTLDADMVDWGHDVNKPDQDWTEQFPRWEPIQAVLSSTVGMRKAKTKYLPMEEEESEANLYLDRLKQAVLFPFYEEGLIGIRSKPFPRPVILKERDGLPDQVQAMESNVDLSGGTVTDWLSEAFWNGLNFGMVHNLTDYSNLEPNTPRGSERKQAHPFFRLVPPVALIGKRYEDQDGKKVLTQVRIRESRLENTGAYGTVRVNLVRVINTDDWELWREEPGTRDWRKVEGPDGEGTNAFPNGIPLRTYYTMKSRFMVSIPPFENVAWLQIAHWQSYAQQRNFLRVIRYALLHGHNLGEDETGQSRVETGVVLGPAQSIITENTEGAFLKWVEHGGAAADAGWKDLEDIEGKAERLTKSILLHRAPGDVKATTAAIDESKGQANIQKWVGDLSRFGHECFQDAAAWVSDTLPDEFRVDVFDDFMAMILGAESMEVVEWMNEQGIIDDETVFEEAKRRRHLSPELTWETIKDRLTTQGPKLRNV